MDSAGPSSSVTFARATVEQLLREKRSADLHEGDASFNDTEFGCPYCHDAETYDVGSLIEHVEDEHGFSNRVVVCPACRRTTRNLVQHLLGHIKPLSGYASCASSASQPSTSRATCQSLDWARTTCCSERSFGTTTAEGEDVPPADLDALSQLDAHSVLSGSDVAELLSLTDSLAVAPPPPQPTTAAPVQSGKVRAGKPPLGEVCEEVEADAPPPEQDRGRALAAQRRARSLYVRHLLVSGFGLGPP